MRQQCTHWRGRARWTWTRGISNGTHSWGQLDQGVKSKRLDDQSCSRRRWCKGPDDAGHVEGGGFWKDLNRMAWLRALNSNSVYMTQYWSMYVWVSLCTSYSMADKKDVIDSGATNDFMHWSFAKCYGIRDEATTSPLKNKEYWQNTK